MTAPVKRETFSAVVLEPALFNESNFDTFLIALRQRLADLKEERFAYYEGLRKANAKWANGARWFLAWLGSVAFLLTGLAAALRLLPPMHPQWDHLDKAVLVVVLAVYALMGAISFYERGTDKTTSYFRHVGIILAIRDLWTRVQFEFAKEQLAVQSATDRGAAEMAARERLRVIANAFCDDLNKATTGELGEWKTEFLASLSALSEAAKKGGEEVTKQVQDIVKDAAKVAADAKTAAEKAAADAKAAAKAAEDAARPGSINFVLSGDFDEEVIVSIDGVEGARTTGKTTAVDRVATGARKIFARSRKAGKDTSASKMVEIKPGIQDVALVLS